MGNNHVTSVEAFAKPEISQLSRLYSIQSNFTTFKVEFANGDSTTVSSSATPSSAIPIGATAIPSSYPPLPPVPYVPTSTPYSPASPAYSPTAPSYSTNSQLVTPLFVVPPPLQVHQAYPVLNEEKKKKEV